MDAFSSYVSPSSWYDWAFSSKQDSHSSYAACDGDENDEVSSLIERKQEEDKQWLVQHPGRFLQTKHGRTHLVTMGDPSGPVVVLSHGVSVFSFVWHEIADVLAEQGYYVIMFDFYGHGWSTIPKVSFTIPLWVEQLEEVVAQLELLSRGPFILIGHSMGGVVNAEYAVRNPTAIKKMVIMNTAGFSVENSIFKNFGPTFLNGTKWVLQNVGVFDQFFYQLERALALSYHIMPRNYEDMVGVVQYMDEKKFGVDLHVSSIENLNKLVNWFLPVPTKRMLKAAHFLMTTWMFQAMTQPERARVFLSVLRECPLLDADYTNTWKQIGTGIDVPLLLAPSNNNSNSSTSSTSSGDDSSSEFCSPTLSHKTDDVNEPSTKSASDSMPDVDGMDLFYELELCGDHEVVHNHSNASVETRKHLFPVMLMWGDADGLTPMAFLEELMEYMPDAEIHVYKGADHSMFLQRPTEAIPRILDFIRTSHGLPSEEEPEEEEDVKTEEDEAAAAQERVPSATADKQ